MRRIVISLVTLLAIASLALAGCQPAGTPEQTPGVEGPSVGETPGEVPETGESPAVDEPMRIRVATDATFPPFEIVDEATQELVGFDIELMNAIAERANLEVEFVNVSWDPLLAGMATCEFDAAISAMTITPERAEQFLFSDPYVNAGQIVVVQIENNEIQGPDDLSGKTAGAQIGTTGAGEIEAIDGATLRTYDTYDLAFLDLANGQIDAVVADYPTALAFLATNPTQLKVVGDVFTDENYGIAVCKDKPEVLERINQGLAAVREEGMLETLTQQWLAGSGG